MDTVATPDLAESPAQTLKIAVQEKGELRLLGYLDTLRSDPSIAVHEGSVDEALADPSLNMLLLGASGYQSIFDRIAEVRRQRPDLRILVASSHGDDETIVRCIQAGAKGYIDEACSLSELLQAVHIVAQGSIWAPRRLLSMFIDRVLSGPPGAFSAAKIDFTPREREVLELLVAGYSNREIARHMNIEERTVKAHVAKLLRKVGVPNRIALTMHTISHALLGPEHS
jgi:DNA-binding NarL/FixJ family response regulator